MKKHIWQFILPRGVPFVNLLASAKLLPVCWRYKRGFYLLSLHKIKMSKQHRLFIL